MGEPVASSPPTPEQARRKWPRRRRLLARALYLLLALALLDLLALLVTGLMLRAEVRRARARRDLLAAKQLLPQAPSGKANAADLYLLAFDSRHLSPRDEPHFIALDGKSAPEWSDDDAALVRRVMATNRAYLRMLADASRIPDCAFPVDWNAGFAAMFPHLSKLRDAGRMLQLRVTLQVRDGQIDAALADCATLLRMAEHAKLEPAIISQLAGYELQSLAVQSLQTALAGGTPSPPDARALLAQLAAIDQTASLVRAVKGELALFYLPNYDTMRRGNYRLPWQELFGLQANDQPRWQAPLLYSYRSVGRPLLNLDEITLLRAMQREIAAFAQPWPRSQESVEATDRWMQSLPAYRTTLSRMLFPFFGRALKTAVTRSASLDAARVALALAIYRSSRGAYPDSLAQLAQAGFQLPADPFGGKPFRYRRASGGIVVYSLGPDLEDDRGRSPGGDHHMSAAQRERLQSRYDVPFYLPR